MNRFNKLLTTLLLAIFVVMLGMLAFWWMKNELPQQAPEEIITLTPTSIDTSISPTITNQQILDTQYINIEIPAGWKVIKNNLVDTPENFATESYILTKDNFQIYINPSTGPTGGPEGGRFAELENHTPSISVAINSQPSPPCAEPIKIKINKELVRNDLYLSSDNFNTWCNPPKGSTVWYGSYVTTPYSGYFGEISKFENTESTKKFLITFGFEGTSNVDNLPQKDSKELEEMLDVMTKIVESIEFK